ncbi:MAG: imelysin family protein [Pseudomonadota bacterium]
MRALVIAVSTVLAPPAFADAPDLKAIVETHVIAGYDKLAREAENLRATVAAHCEADHPALHTAYHLTFDAWVGVSHLRFGPSEQNDRAFALAFWPDPRGSTPKALAALIRDEDPAVFDAEEFSTVSIAARGFYALEFLLFDPQFASVENRDYHCALIQAATTDIALNATAILEGWEDGYGALMSSPGNNTYRNPTEAAQQLFTSLSTGLEFTSQTRLGRPMGTFERPLPNRAEARRSERSLRHVILALEATQTLAALISNESEDLDLAFKAALQRAKDLNDPVFSSVSTPQGRLKVEVLQQSIETIRSILNEDVGPSLGIAAGFNSLDGD